MVERWLGATNSADEITLVLIDITESDATVIEDCDITLQSGDKAEKYQVAFDRLFSYISENRVENFVLKASAVPMGGRKLGHFEAAEVREILITAASKAGAKVWIQNKSTLSRVFGKRKAREYIDDDDFWESHLNGMIRKKSREAVYLVFATLGVYSD